MTRAQKNKTLDQIRKAFLVRDNVALNKPVFETVLEMYGVKKDKFVHYREYGYEFEKGKWIRCIK